MAESLGSWIARAIIQHDEKYGANLTVHWTGQRLCQVIGFDTYRTPEDPHRQILGRISDQTHWVHVRFDVTATDEQEKPIPGMQAETLTSHLRYIFLIKHFKIRLSAPPAPALGRRAGARGPALPRVELDILDWDVYDGDRHDPVFWENAVQVGTGKDAALVQRILAKWWIGESYSDPSQQSPEAVPSRANQSVRGSDHEDPLPFEEFLEPYLNPPDGRKAKPIPEYIFDIPEEAQRELAQISVFGLDLDRPVEVTTTPARSGIDAQVPVEGGKNDNLVEEFEAATHSAPPDSPLPKNIYPPSQPRLSTLGNDEAARADTSESEEDMPIRRRGRLPPIRRDVIDPSFFSDSPGRRSHDKTNPLAEVSVDIAQSSRVHLASQIHSNKSQGIAEPDEPDPYEHDGGGEDDDEDLSDYERNQRQRGKGAAPSLPTGSASQAHRGPSSAGMVAGPSNESLGESQPAEDFSLSRYATQAPPSSRPPRTIIESPTKSPLKQNTILVDNSDESHNKAQNVSPSQTDSNSHSRSQQIPASQASPKSSGVDAPRHDASQRESPHEGDDEHTLSHSPQSRKRQKREHEYEHHHETALPNSAGRLSYLNPINLFRSSPRRVDREMGGGGQDGGREDSPTRDARSRGGSVLGRLFGWGTGEDRDGHSLKPGHLLEEQGGDEDGDLGEVQEEGDDEGEEYRAEDLGIEANPASIGGSRAAQPSMSMGQDDVNLLNGSGRVSSVMEMDIDDIPSTQAQHAAESAADVSGVRRVVDERFVQNDNFSVSPGRDDGDDDDRVDRLSTEHDSGSPHVGVEASRKQERAARTEGEAAAIVAPRAAVSVPVSSIRTATDPTVMTTATTATEPIHPLPAKTTKPTKLRGFKPVLTPIDGLPEDWVIRMTTSVVAARQRTAQPRGTN